MTKPNKVLGRGRCPLSIKHEYGPDTCELNTKVCLLESDDKCETYDEEMRYVEEMERAYGVKEVSK